MGCPTGSWVGTRNANMLEALQFEFMRNALAAGLCASLICGIIGTLGLTLGKNGVNIANFTLGRSAKGKDAIALLYVDDPVPTKVIKQLKATELFTQVRPLQFEVS